MQDEQTGGPPHQHGPHDHAEGWRRQVYYVTVEWLDRPHAAQSPDRLAQALQRALEHSHNVPPGSPPARFVLRVKGDEVTAEVQGVVEHHHHGPR